VGSGIAVYSRATRRAERILDRGIAPHWLPEGRQIAFFERQQVNVIDLTSGRIRNAPVAPLQGVALHHVAVPPRLSRDGTTLYVRQTLEQGDVWMVRDNE
jgi:hypothetical protein